MRKPDKIGVLDALSTKDRAQVQRMTNWQRTQWARAGYPVQRVSEFAQKQRRLEADRCA